MSQRIKIFAEAKIVLVENQINNWLTETKATIINMNTSVNDNTVVVVVSYKLPKEPIKKDNKRNSYESELLFEKFWNEYDKKQGRHKCYQTWINLTPEEQQKAVEQSKVYSEWITQNNKKDYKKHPLTWLNGRHWEDVLEVKPKINPNNPLNFM